MRRHFLFVVIGISIMVGCVARTPVAPDTGRPSLATQQRSPSDDPHRLWGTYELFISAAHDRVDVVPKREARFHLNALKFLESYCADCLKITKIKNNGDGTIDLTVKITHPFKGHPEYTGFDVKGIIMFNGSHIMDTLNSGPAFGLPEPSVRVSWREMGDPQVLNPDGYTLRWSPNYDSGSSLPIFNYWKGKYATGEPNADVNAYLDYYTTADRHMFAVDSSVSRTYKISLPAGKPLIAGYAVEACWEPATVTPVKDPLKDFPFSANQSEPYCLVFSVNNGEPVKAHSNCCQGFGDCSDSWVEVKQWGGVNVTYYSKYSEAPYGSTDFIEPCEPPELDIQSFDNFAGSGDKPPGKYQWLYVAAQQVWPIFINYAYDLMEFEVIE
jgi:hypothetical protein